MNPATLFSNTQPDCKEDARLGQVWRMRQSGVSALRRMPASGVLRRLTSEKGLEVA